MQIRKRSRPQHAALILVSSPPPSPSRQRCSDRDIHLRVLAPAPSAAIILGLVAVARRSAAERLVMRSVRSRLQGISGTVK
ncbi:hypothetical protein EJ03DRAFT_17006 [Teratosphaeria nubilosa]|uniref:Uncharacterized protein n=1 Tax=Teratosphaeria nubilosa TaxID=161662 RepID=A0A6G1KWG0_9PEZI|nr:hypothetical protein EJ03DRAFT_17006 [Teratosphaeria nubilosa]